MDQSICRLTLLPEDTSAEISAGTTLREGLAQLGITVTAPCGGEGTCGKCRVALKDGAVLPLTTSEQVLLTAEQHAGGVRLSCQARIQGDVQVTVPPDARTTDMRVLLGGVSRDVPIDPLLRKVAVEMPPQTLSEPYHRMEHLRRCGDLRHDLRADLALLRRFPQILKDSDGTVTVVMSGAQLLDLEPGDTTDCCYGVALDLGTTTVVATVVDLISGKEVGRASTVNEQAAHGHDVIGRINYTIEQADGLEALQQAALASLNAVAEQAAARAGIALTAIYEATVVGNATMMHLLLGISPDSLGHLPYVATAGDPVEALASDVGLRLHPKARVYVLPNIAGYVGGDTVGVILATGLDEDDGRIRMVADIGTNCEIALRLGDRLLVTSTPAGPAFEGARITSGMYAAPGAIEAVSMDGEVHCKTIGGEAPRGLCGSGLVDVGAELLRTGIVDWTGRMLPNDELESDLAAGFSDRLITNEKELAFVLAETEDNGPIVLTQRDFRELQLAKGAIRSGIELLLEHAGLGLDDVDEFCIAGGFGNYLDKGNAIRLGIIPPLPPEKIRFVGNGALVGAKLVLQSNPIRTQGEQVARQSDHLQLAGTPDFQMRFSEAMLFEMPA